MNERCQTCRYVHKTEGDNGEVWLGCHRYAPRPRSADYVPAWPTVLEDDWCGEWRPVEVMYRPANN